MTKRQTAEIQKPRIIQSFYETILEHGFEGASIAKVADRIHIHATLILHYFGTKENMTLALVDFVLKEYGKLFKKLRSRQDHADPERRMQVLFNTVFSKPYYEKINIAATLSVVAVSFRNQRIRKKIKFLYDQFRHLLIQELEDLSQLNAIPPQDVDRTAAVLISMIEGARHFHPFLTRPKGLKTYNQDLSLAAIGMIKDSSWQRR